MQYNPLIDLVAGIVMILMPILLLCSFGLWLLISHLQKSKLPPEPRPIDESILKSLELLREHHYKLLEGMRDLSEDNRQRLEVLREETDKIRDLLKQKTASSTGRELPYSRIPDFRDN